jgi:hypothetical protein
MNQNLPLFNKKVCDIFAIRIRSFCISGKHQTLKVGEVQNTLNQKVDSKPSRTVDFASRFVMIIESMNFKLKFY